MSKVRRCGAGGFQRLGIGSIVVCCAVLGACNFYPEMPEGIRKKLTQQCLEVGGLPSFDMRGHNRITQVRCNMPGWENM